MQERRAPNDKIFNSFPGFVISAIKKLRNRLQFQGDEI